MKWKIQWSIKWFVKNWRMSRLNHQTVLDWKSCNNNNNNNQTMSSSLIILFKAICFIYYQYLCVQNKTYLCIIQWAHLLVVSKEHKYILEDFATFWQSNICIMWLKIFHYFFRVCSSWIFVWLFVWKYLGFQKYSSMGQRDCLRWIIHSLSSLFPFIYSWGVLCNTITRRA